MRLLEKGHVTPRWRGSAGHLQEVLLHLGRASLEAHTKIHTHILKLALVVNGLDAVLLVGEVEVTVACQPVFDSVFGVMTSGPGFIGFGVLGLRMLMVLWLGVRRLLFRI